jgi:hypothetical protein
MYDNCPCLVVRRKRDRAARHCRNSEQTEQIEFPSKNWLCRFDGSWLHARLGSDNLASGNIGGGSSGACWRDVGSRGSRFDHRRDIVCLRIDRWRRDDHQSKCQRRCRHDTEVHRKHLTELGGPLNGRAPSSRTITVLANERRPSLEYYPLVTTGAGALPLPTKQPPKLSAVTTNASASATFFIEFPFSNGPFVGSVSDEVCELLSSRSRPAASSDQKGPHPRRTLH